MKPATNTTRRSFLRNTMATTLLTPALTSIAKAAPQAASSPTIIDTNTYLGSWPFRHHALAEPSALAAKLKQHGVMEAWVSSLDGLLQRDMGGVNSRLAESCKQHAIFKPIGVINPMLPRWEDDIEQCANQHHMRGIRLHPNYHGHTLDDPRFIELMKLATAHKLFVQIACVMEDERTQHPKLQVAPVDVSALPKALEAAPDARVMLLNWQKMSGGKPTLNTLKGAIVLYDIAMLEGIAGLEALLEELSVEHIVFGSYAPVFYFEAAKLKLQESALNEQQLNAITHENAKRLLAA